MAKRVYFAFHYQDVIDFRANVVRKHNFLGGVQVAGYYDHSIWEDAKKTSPLALKRLINARYGVVDRITFDESVSGEEVIEGFQAFVEKRDPAWIPNETRKR